MQRLDLWANHHPTVVLVEIPSTTSHTTLDHSTAHDSASSLSLPEDAVAFLRKLKINISGARFQNLVIPFALLTTSDSDAKALDAEATAHYLQAGAEEIISSPILTPDLNRLVGHVMEKTRPPARLVGSAMAQNLVNSIREYSSYSPACHRPDEVISPERMEFVKEAVSSWGFPAHELDMDELTCAVMLMLEHLLRAEQLEQYSLPREDLVAFLLATRRQYKHEQEVYYHNWRHAVDVTQSIYQFLLSVGLCPPADPSTAQKKDLSSVEKLITPLDGLLLLVSAIGHDVGHPGVNNAFLVACNHPLAQLYNDKSVLENYHCAAYSQLIRRHWPSMHRLGSFRQVLISNVLATDMQRHFEYMSHLTELRQKLGDSHNSTLEWGEKEKDQTRELIMALMMKAADISNIARPFDISASWAKILSNEFSRQGELEQELDIPTCLFGGPPNREDLLAAAQSQKGFMNLFGFPLFQGLSDVMPSISCSVQTLERNQKAWELRIAEEVSRRKDADESHATFASLGQKHDVEVLQRHRQSEPTVVPLEAAQPPTTPPQWRPSQTQSGSPVRHPATDERKRFQTGFFPREDGKRSSAPTIGPGAIHLSPGKAASRRSSKDVALDQMHQLSLFTHQASTPGSRRGSTDAGFQLNQSYPQSRRGSKDESLTTILVTSQNNAGRGSPGSKSGRVKTAESPTRSKTRSNDGPTRQMSGGNTSLPSAHSHAASSATAMTGDTDHSPSTQPSSLAQADHEESIRVDGRTGQMRDGETYTFPSAPSSLEGSGQSVLTPEAFPPTPPLLSERSSKGSSSPRVVSRMTDGEEEDNGRATPRKVEHGALRESRSRSRLRSLKFWKKKKDVNALDGQATSP